MLGKIIILTLLLTACSASPLPIRVYGKVYRQGAQHLTPLGNRLLSTSGSYTFPEVKLSKFLHWSNSSSFIKFYILQNPKSNIVIRGVEFVDYANKPARIEFNNAEFDSKQVTFTVNAPPGANLNTQIFFYGDKIVSVQFQLKQYLIQNQIVTTFLFSGFKRCQINWQSCQSIFNL